MTTFANRSGIGLVCTLAFVLAACSGSGNGIDDQTQLPPAGTTGFFNLSVSDAPIKDATKVCIRFDGVELRHADSDDIHIIARDLTRRLGNDSARALARLILSGETDELQEESS